jgi:hypothetical protein
MIAEKTAWSRKLDDVSVSPIEIRLSEQERLMLFCVAHALRIRAEGGLGEGKSYPSGIPELCGVDEPSLRVYVEFLTHLESYLSSKVLEEGDIQSNSDVVPDQGSKCDREARMTNNLESLAPGQIWQLPSDGHHDSAVIVVLHRVEDSQTDWQVAWFGCSRDQTLTSCGVRTVNKGDLLGSDGICRGSLSTMLTVARLLPDLRRALNKREDA